MTSTIEPAPVGDIPVASHLGSSNSPVSPPQRWQCLLFPLMLTVIQVSDFLIAAKESRSEPK